MKIDGGKVAMCRCRTGSCMEPSLMLELCCVDPHASRPQSMLVASGSHARYPTLEIVEAPAVRAEAWKIVWKVTPDELKQLDLLTSATSEGSAKVMSTHWDR